MAQSKSFPNTPVLGVEPASPSDYVGELIEGFRDCYDLLQANRNELLDQKELSSLFAGARTRIVFRTSNQYALTLQTLAEPSYQRSGLKRSLAIETLNRVFQYETERPLLWPLVAEETRALDDELDVPRFLVPVDSDVLTAASGETVKGYLKASGLRAAEGRLRAFDPADRERQIDLLRAALKDPLGTTFHRRFDGEGEPTFAGYADWIADEILENKDDWGAIDGRGLGSDDLYRGSFGIGFFLAALASEADVGADLG